MTTTFSSTMSASPPAIALSSSLASRSTPSPPPASQVYEPLVKSVLARRYTRYVLSVSAAAAWAIGALWTSWQLGGVDSLGIFGGIANWLSPLTLLCAVVWWTLASMPIAVSRKLNLQATYFSLLSPRQTILQHIRERQYQLALAGNLLTSASLAAFHAIMAQTIEKYSRGDPDLGIWAGSRKHPYHLNGRLCFLLLSQMTSALIYWLRDVLRNRFSIRWSSQSDFLVHAFPLVSHSVTSMLMLSTVSTIFSLLIFAVLRSIVLPLLYRLPIVYNFLRPFMAHFLRPTYTITFLWSHLDLVIRALLLTLSTCILWEVPSTMFDAVFSLPAAATEGCKDAGLILVSGINSSDAYLQLHAFHDLTQLASDSVQTKSKRAIIYNDTKHNPTLWAALVRRSLLLLGADYQLFLRRGNPPPPPPAPMAPVAKPTTTEKPVTPVIRTQVYKTPHVRPIDRIADVLASDSPIPSALARSGEKIELPKVIEKTLRSRVHAIRANIASPKPPDAVTRTISTVSRFVASSSPWALELSTWWTRERKDRAAQKALPNRELDVMIVEVLSKMVARSLTEDKMGLVQRDIPRILEAMVLFLSALEDYQKDLVSFLTAKEASVEVDHVRLLILKEETSRANGWIEGLSEGLRTGISLVVRTFGDSLSKYKFPPKIAAKLQIFADYALS